MLGRDQPQTGRAQAEASETEMLIKLTLMGACPTYSTVTLLARLRGWSTSQPRRTAMW